MFQSSVKEKGCPQRNLHRDRRMNICYINTLYIHQTRVPLRCVIVSMKYTPLTPAIDLGVQLPLMTYVQVRMALTLTLMSSKFLHVKGLTNAKSIKCVQCTYEPRTPIVRDGVGYNCALGSCFTPCPNPGQGDRMKLKSETTEPRLFILCLSTTLRFATFTFTLLRLAAFINTYMSGVLFQCTGAIKMKYTLIAHTDRRRQGSRHRHPSKPVLIDPFAFYKPYGLLLHLELVIVSRYK